MTLSASEPDCGPPGRTNISTLRAPPLTHAPQRSGWSLPDSGSSSLRDSGHWGPQFKIECEEYGTTLLEEDSVSSKGGHIGVPVWYEACLCSGSPMQVVEGRRNLVSSPQHVCLARMYVIIKLEDSEAPCREGS